MKPLLILGIGVLLAACASPYETCLRQSSRDLTIVRALIDDTEATLERGYAIQTKTRTVLYTDFCIGTGHNHGRFRFCTRAEAVQTRVAVAVDLNAERAKLRSLKAKETELIRETAKAQQQCARENPVQS